VTATCVGYDEGKLVCVTQLPPPPAFDIGTVITAIDDNTSINGGEVSPILHTATNSAYLYDKYFMRVVTKIPTATVVSTEVDGFSYPVQVHHSETVATTICTVRQIQISPGQVIPAFSSLTAYAGRVYGNLTELVFPVTLHGSGSDWRYLWHQSVGPHFDATDVEGHPETESAFYLEMPPEVRLKTYPLIGPYVPFNNPLVSTADRLEIDYPFFTKVFYETYPMPVCSGVVASASRVDINRLLPISQSPQRVHLANFGNNAVKGVPVEWLNFWIVSDISAEWLGTDSQREFYTDQRASEFAVSLNQLAARINSSANGGDRIKVVVLYDMDPPSKCEYLEQKTPDPWPTGFSPVFRPLPATQYGQGVTSRGPSVPLYLPSIYTNPSTAFVPSNYSSQAWAYVDDGEIELDVDVAWDNPYDDDYYGAPDSFKYGPHRKRVIELRPTTNCHEQVKSAYLEAVQTSISSLNHPMIVWGGAISEGDDVQAIMQRYIDQFFL
jgi:hypothetical protein